LLLSNPVQISRCVWHSRNFGHGKLLGISRWRGRGLAFVDGLCDRCAQRIHPEVRARVIHGASVPRRGCTLGIVAVALSVVTALVLAAIPTSDLAFRHAPPSEVARPTEARPPEERLPPVAASLQAPPLRQPPSSQATSGSSPRTARLASAAHRAAPGSETRVSRARASRQRETSRSATGRIFYQSP
jgi:type IV secretory pathway VirB10-like protein